jgi:hypothetical protein
MVVALIALFVALGGTGIAARHYLITSTSQIKPSVLAKLKGKTGPPGREGPQGKEGAVGKAGERGEPGATGAGASVVSAQLRIRTGAPDTTFLETPTVSVQTSVCRETFPGEANAVVLNPRELEIVLPGPQRTNAKEIHTSIAKAEKTVLLIAGADGLHELQLVTFSLGVECLFDGIYR